MEGYRTQDDGWWRVIRADGDVDWTDCDPRELLDGAWQDATVEGPFVPASDLRGAVEALEKADALGDAVIRWKSHVALEGLVGDYMAARHTTRGRYDASAAFPRKDQT